MDIYDLMYLYFPRRKATINRVREMDRISHEEAKIKAADNKYVSKGTAGDILSTALLADNICRMLSKDGAV